MDTSVTHQRMMGFGGALTQASASVYRDLPDQLKKEVIAAYYGPDGIGTCLHICFINYPILMWRSVFLLLVFRLQYWALADPLL